MAKPATTKNPVRWGVISTANIGTQKVIPGMMASGIIDVRAIASRTQPTARRWAKKLGIPVAYGSYEDMLNDPEVEAVYNPLPNHLHVPLTLEAAAKGKHVLCEKPIALSGDEAKTMRGVARKVHIAEAFMVRCHPQWLKARDLVQSGRLGTIRAINTLFSYYNVDPKNVRNMADIGGGALYDIGCYPIVTARFLLGAEPVRCFGLIDRDPKFKTDRTTSAVIDFGKGRHMTFSVSTQATAYQRVQVLGDKARLEVEIPFNAPQGGAMKLYLDNGKQFADASAKMIKLPKADQYQLQGEWFSRVVRGQEKLTFGLSDAIRQARVLDAVFRSAETGQWEKP
ncbi:Gfo/Idh/MocA family protein [Bauldia sp.]|uniref:Gfo/Idh/MocA family protein n=1 Tax=Bauldia sp. TaxID=2575872 RepID=UPI003BAB81DB